MHSRVKAWGSKGGGVKRVLTSFRLIAVSIRAMAGLYLAALDGASKLSPPFG